MTTDNEKQQPDDEAAPPRSRAYERLAVVFIKPHGIYNSGETAGFNPPMALAMFESGVARPLDGDWRGVMTPAERARSEQLQREANRRLRRAQGTSAEQLDDEDLEAREREAAEREANGENTPPPENPTPPAVSDDNPLAGNVAQVKTWLQEPRDRDLLSKLYDIEASAERPRSSVLSAIEAAIQEAPAGNTQPEVTV